ncbi:alkylhydroperoxidase domain protein [Brenneria izadpanahii]|uniref:Alkylhydroperoxidase domain protein n=1 Tax=Brenneria izadpanahii TaxID=2722756 RepID=A0ABX7USF0_9GAMM|nr:alkylhydroperoxidase domain protein [Brenneria izadpanahii]QTF08684.1 alkylhydroperoxidase domain protein [Brenneria izadpanahii]
MTRHEHDILNTLAEIAPDSELAQARHTRDAAARHTEGSYRALFSADDGNSALPLSLRLWLAENISAWHQDGRLQRFYAQRRKDFPAPPQTPAIDAALQHAERLTLDPVGGSPADLQALLAAGWTEDDIVTLSQTTAFVSFQSRLLRGYRLLAGHEVDNPPPRNATAGRWHTHERTLSGQRAPQAFTQADLGWEPWIAPKALNEFNADEQALLARFGHSDSDYFRLLGRDLPVLEQRTLTDKGIFYTSGGLPRAERELAAAVASKVNGCIFCASVHARKASQLSKQNDAVQRLLDAPPGADLAQEQNPRWQAIIAFAARLSSTPAQVNAHDLARLREHGLNTLEILDLVQSAAFFAWANRLMLTLGEPFWPAH